MLQVMGPGIGEVLACKGARHRVGRTVVCASPPWWRASAGISGCTSKPLRTGAVDLIAVDSAANTIYLLSYESGTVTVLDGARLTMKRREGGKQAWGMAVDEASHTLYVARDRKSV